MEYRLVDDAVVEKKLVEVAEVEVEVVDWILVEVSLERVLSQRRAAASASSPPVEMYGMRPDVRLEMVAWPAVTAPMMLVLVLKSVVEALVLKKLVEVAEVEVEFRAVKFWRVVEARVWRAPVESILKSSEPAALLKVRNLPLKPVVEEAEIKLPVVEVAFTWKREDKFSDAVVVAPTTNDL